MVESRDATAEIHPIPPGDITICFLSPGETAAAWFNNGNQYRQARNPPPDVLWAPDATGDPLSGRNGSSTYARKAPPVHHIRLQSFVAGDHSRATPTPYSRQAAGYNGARFPPKD